MISHTRHNPLAQNTLSRTPLTMNVVSGANTNGFWALRAARTPGISTFLYMPRPQLVGPLIRSSGAATTVDPDDSPVNGPFLDDDSLAAFQSTECDAKPRCACLRSNTRNAEHPRQQGHGFTTIPGKSECLIHSRSRYT